jgi:glycerol-3-phosphate dehydrogenase
MTPGAAASETIELAKQAQIIDHAKDGLEGLISVLGVKYTTARRVSERAIELVFRKLGYRRAGASPAAAPIHGGAIDRYEAFVSREGAVRPPGVTAETIRHLIERHGSEYRSVLRLLEEDAGRGESLGATSAIGAEVVHAVRFEMAQKLADVVFRRTGLGSAGNPGEASLRACARVMAEELGWEEAKVRRELDEVRAVFPGPRAAEGLVGAMVGNRVK